MGEDDEADPFLLTRKFAVPLELIAELDRPPPLVPFTSDRSPGRSSSVDDVQSQDPDADDHHTHDSGSSPEEEEDKPATPHPESDDSARPLLVEPGEIESNTGILCCELIEERDRISRLEAFLHEQLEQNDSLQSEVAELRIRVEELESQRALSREPELEALVGELQAQLCEMVPRDELEDLKRRLRNSEEEVEDLKSAFVHSEHDSEHLRAARAQCEALAQHLQDCERELTSQRAVGDTMAAELQQLRSENALLRNELRTHRRSSKPPPEPITPVANRQSRIPKPTRRVPQSQLGERPPRVDDEVVVERPKPLLRQPVCDDVVEAVPEKPGPPAGPMTADEMSAKMDELKAERAEVERQLSKAMPKEKGSVLARLRQEREEMELRVEEVGKEISKLKLGLRVAGRK
jgi:hypothetical protein